MHAELWEKELVYAITGCVYEVYRELGHGFLEKVYKNALRQELVAQGFAVQNQVPLMVTYKGETVGEYFADLIVDDRVVIELKAQDKVHKAHEAQILNYLKASGKKVGLLVNFAYPKATVKRFVF